jgi:thiol-disulfide isomerase/thioredoxin
MKIIFLLVYILPLCSIAQKRFHIVGTFLNTTKSKTITIGDNTINVNNNKFELYGYITKSQFAFIYTENTFNWGLWLSVGEYKMEVEEWGEENTKNGKRYLRITKIEAPEEAMQLIAMQKYQEELNVKAFQNKLAKDSVNYFYCIKLLAYAKQVKKNELLDELLNKLPDDKFSIELLKEVSIIQKNSNYSSQIRAKKLLLKGTVLDDFSQTTNADTLFRFYNTKAKYILLDFWASWCGPCRRKHPYFVNLYKKHKDKGFVIISISLDTDKGKWLSAIKQDGLKWINVSELKSWKGQIPQKYAITQIPANIFLNEKFEVITTDASLGVIEAFLKELK